MKKRSLSQFVPIGVVFLIVCGIFVSIFFHRFLPKRPNVIVIMIDALRRDHLGVYGYDRPTSPNIDRFAQDATVFPNAISPCSWTNPSITSFFSSLYPSTHGVLSYRQKKHVVEADSMPLKIVTMAELFQKKGYATAAYVANRWITPELNFDQGFDVYDTINDDIKARAEDLNPKALQWIIEHKDEPFFAYLHYMDVHSPYEPPEPYHQQFNTTGIKLLRKYHLVQFGPSIFIQYMLDRYDGEIAYVDQHIGLLLDRLKAEGVLENTIVIIASDHGEAFMEHGHGGHGRTLYREEINIPLIIKFPDTVSAKRFPLKNAALIDVPKTLISLIGAEFPYAVSGKNLLNVSQETLLKRKRYAEELAPIVKGPPKVALIQGQWKAIYRPRESDVTELYNFKNDPGEKQNLLNNKSKKSAQFKALIEENLSRFSAKRQGLGLTQEQASFKDREKLEKLRSLGYLQ